jgi:N-formylglutamate amidohydrolase
MKLPILISVPHAGLRVPEEAQPYCRLTHEEIVADGDEGATEIYSIADEVVQLVTTFVVSVGSQLPYDQSQLSRHYGTL